MTTPSGPGRIAGQPDPGLAAIMSERRQLINVAYRLLGSLAEAEDAVQETYARWYALTPAQRDAIESPGAWLTTVTSRICLDQLGSARARRERYVGQWIPEPLPEPAEWVSSRPGGPADPADRITLDESVSMAFLVVLESMTPAERVAFILHDVFGYPFTEIAAHRRPHPGRLPPAGLLRPPPHPRRPTARRPPPLARPRSSATSRTPGRPATSPPSSACSTPTPPSPPTAAAWPPPPCTRSRAPSRSPATWPAWPATHPA